jgi:hypothetical protein
LLTLILFLGSGEALQAEPLDSPGVVYIDGQPCNRACQSYMDWSYRAQSARHHAARETTVALPAETQTDRVEPVARPPVARHAAPVTRTAPRAGKAAWNGRTTGSKASNNKIAAPKATPHRVGREIPEVAAALPPQGAFTALQPAQAPASGLKPEVKSEVAASIALPPPATLEIAARPSAPAPGTTSNNASEIGKSASASSDDQDNLVALVLARPEINSLSDLNNKNIAITEKQSASSGRVSTALMAAGAAEVMFSEVKVSAIERLVSGEVPAAVLLASREVVDLFPELEGFRTFRVPLKGRL